MSPKTNDWKELARIIAKHISDSLPDNAHEQECLMVVSLDSYGYPKDKAHCIAMGTVDNVRPAMRDIFRQAIRDNATSIMIAHTHPSGNLAPSLHDLQFTGALVQIAEVLDIDLVDHLILSGNKGLSIKAHLASLDPEQCNCPNCVAERQGENND